MSQRLLETAMQHHQAGRLSQAAQFYRQFIAEQPGHVAAYNNLGAALAAAGEIDEAIIVYRKALELQPGVAEIHKNLGTALFRAGRLEEAAAAFTQTLALRPNFPEALNSLAIVLNGLDRPDEAIDALRRSVALKPDYVDALRHLGNALYAASQSAEAIASLEKAAALQPNNPAIRWDLSMALLRSGDFSRGWKEFESRQQVPGLHLARGFHQPQWMGETIGGRSVLLHAQGGFGDTLQFIRYVPLVAWRGVKVVVECQPELISLFRQMLEISELVPRGQPLPPFHWHVPLSSLPLVMRTTLSTLPATVPYLSPPPDRVAHWREKFVDDHRFKVGIVWAGSEKSLRSDRLEMFAPLANIPNVHFVSLQKGTDADQKPQGGMAISDFSAELHDFGETACLIQQLDLVIGVDTAVIHLAGALGKPVWVLIPRACDFRWMFDRTDSPWYPSMRLFRQEGDWKNAISQIESALRSLAK